MAEWDSRITQLTREKEELQAQLRKTERELKLKQSKTQGVHRLIGLLEEHVRNPGDLVIKARLYDKAVAKIRGVTALKMIHICMDYSTRMENHPGGNEDSLRQPEPLLPGQSYFARKGSGLDRFSRPSAYRVVAKPIDANNS